MTRPELAQIALSSLLANPEITDLRDLFSDWDEITTPAVEFADALIEAMKYANIPENQHLAVTAAWAGLLANPKINDDLNNNNSAFLAAEAIQFAEALQRDLDFKHPII
jgi:hypothetical protein